MSEIGKKIKRIRNKYRLSQERFAKRIGVSGKTVSAYETGKSSPPLKILEKISNEYQVSLVHMPKQHSPFVKQKLEEIKKTIKELELIFNSGMSINR